MATRNVVCLRHPDKRRYSSRRDADVALTKSIIYFVGPGPMPDRYPQRVYECACGGWHLTSRENWP